MFNNPLQSHFQPNAGNKVLDKPHLNKEATASPMIQFGKLGDNFKRATEFSLTVKENREAVIEKLAPLYEHAELGFWKTQSSKRKQTQNTLCWGNLQKDEDETQLLLMKKIKYNNPNTPVLKLTITEDSKQNTTTINGTFTEVKTLWTHVGTKLPAGMAGAGVLLGALVNPAFLLYIPIGGGTYAFTKKMVAKESAELKSAVVDTLKS